MSDASGDETVSFLSQIKECACEPDKVYLYVDHAKKSHTAAIKELVEELKSLREFAIKAEIVWGIDNFILDNTKRLIKKYGGGL